MFLPADGGMPFTLFLNPRAGCLLPGHRAAAGTAQDRAPQRYREAYGYLDYAAPVAHGPAVLSGAELADQADGDYYVLDDAGRALPLPAALVAAATCTLNATIHPDAVLLLETLPLRVPEIADVGGDRLDPISADAELRAFAEQYTREELAGFVCPTDREAWASRWLEAFQQIYAPRHAEQRARLERALAGLLAWLDGVDKA
jgi:hypothetical protein